MPMKDELDLQVKNILRESWDVRDGRVIPDAETVALRGGAVRIRACMLFCDLVASSQLAEDYQKRTAAKVYKAFLGVAARLASNNGGTVTAFDGDRIMAAFAGDSMCNNAVRTAMQMTWTMDTIIEPALTSHFQSLGANGFSIRHCTGIDVGDVLVVKAGNRSANDLVWVGRATNLAARLSEVRIAERTLTSLDVYQALDDNHRLNNGQNMWTAYDLPFLGGIQKCAKTAISWRI